MKHICVVQSSNWIKEIIQIVQQAVLNYIFLSFASFICLVFYQKKTSQK